LQEAIIGMAQIYPGSNNICVLHPSGNHGHRNMGGKDHASPRYIFTNIEPLTFNIFRKEDEVILNHLIEEGESVEPEFYYPITPMVLVNGGTGVGTGYSSSVLQYNPKDINNNLFRRMDGKHMLEMIPWYNGFTGTIDKMKENEYMVMGKFELVQDNYNAVRITEIPIKRKQYCWIADYYNFLKTLESDDKGDNKIIAKVHPNAGGNDEIDILVEFKPNEFQKLYKKGDEAIIKFFKLSTTMTASNLHMYNASNNIIKYSDPLEVMEEFFETRLKMYELRKSIHQKILLNELEILKFKVKFIEDYRAKKIIIQDRSENVINGDLKSLGYPRLSTKYDALEEDKSYSYLTNMRLWSLSQERIDE
jgi:DNA topoisomerase-2